MTHHTCTLLLRKPDNLYKKFNLREEKNFFLLLKKKKHESAISCHQLAFPEEKKNLFLHLKSRSN